MALPGHRLRFICFDEYTWGEPLAQAFGIAFLLFILLLAARVRCNVLRSLVTPYTSRKNFKETVYSYRASISFSAFIAVVVFVDLLLNEQHRLALQIGGGWEVFLRSFSTGILILMYSLVVQHLIKGLSR